MDTPCPDRIRVGILHSEPLITAGVIHSLVCESGIDVMPAEEGRWRGADVVVTDLRTGLRLAGELRFPRPGPTNTRLLVLSSDDRESEVRRALESGVHGYLLANCDAGELVRCVRAVGTGSRYLSLAVAQRVAESLAREQLTAREGEVLQLLAKGQCNKSIARNLAISVGTAKAHVKAILAKLDAHSRTHAVAVAVARGLVHQENAV